MAESVIPGHGVITSEFFDVGCSRRVPWVRRPRAAALLGQAQGADCRFDAVVVGEFERAYPGRIVGVGQDPEDKLAEFDRELEMGFGSVADLPPYELSNAYQIGVVPTLFLVSPEGVVLESVESWNRDGFNQVSKHLAVLTDAEYAPISEPSDGLPSFRPG